MLHKDGRDGEPTFSCAFLVVLRLFFGGVKYITLAHVFVSAGVQDDTSKHRRQEREKNLGFAKEFRRQADDASGAERDALLQKAQSFFQKVCVRAPGSKLDAYVSCLEDHTGGERRRNSQTAVDMMR